MRVYSTVTVPSGSTLTLMPVLDILQELVAQLVDDGHVGVRPVGGEDGPGGRETVDGHGKQHARGLVVRGAAV